MSHEVSAAIGESDEEFAQRLQSQELIQTDATGNINRHLAQIEGVSINSRNSAEANPNTPLINNPHRPYLIYNYGSNNNNNNNSLNAFDDNGFGDNNDPANMRIEGGTRNRNNNPLADVDNVTAAVNELATSGTAVILVLSINLPQVVATAVVLSMYWNGSTLCRQIWNLWALISGLRMLSYSSVVASMYFLRTYLRPRFALLHNIRKYLDIFGLIWFIIGWIWIFNNNNPSCANSSSSPVYNLCLTMMIITLVQIFLPSILAFLLILVSFCIVYVPCCMPCLIRVLTWLRADDDNKEGASQDLINELPLVTITEDQLAEERTCPVCLNDMVAGDEARALPCRHLFHKQCVSEWLLVNATCPTCRRRVFPSRDRDQGDDNNDGDHRQGDRSSMIMDQSERNGLLEAAPIAHSVEDDHSARPGFGTLSMMA